MEQEGVVERCEDVDEFALAEDDDLAVVRSAVDSVESDVRSRSCADAALNASATAVAVAPLSDA